MGVTSLLETTKNFNSHDMTAVHSFWGSTRLHRLPGLKACPALRSWRRHPVYRVHSHMTVQKFSFYKFSPSLNDFSRKSTTYYLTLCKNKDWKNPFQKSSKFHSKEKPAHQGVSGAAFWTVCISMQHMRCRHSICGNKHAWHLET